MLLQENPFNILHEPLPCCVTVDGVDYTVKTSFRDWVRFFTLHEDGGITSEEKILRSMELYTDGRPDSIFAAYAALQRFAACDRMPRNEKHETGAYRKAPVFSYLYDSTYILSDFLRYYGIDLRTAEMHWYEFTAMFDGLPQEAETKQRIAYRSLDLSGIKNRERRAQVRRVQDAIRIPHENISAAEIGGVLW